MVNPARPGTLGAVGHVAYVERVIDANHYVTSERNTYGNGGQFVIYNWAGTKGNSEGLPARQHRPGTKFIYVRGAEPVDIYANWIVQWDGDRKPQTTAWLVTSERGRIHRRWIPSIAVYDCLRRRGHPGPKKLPAVVLDRMPDLTGVWAQCNIGGGGPPPPPPPPPPGPPPPSPPPPPPGPPPPPSPPAPITLTVYNQVTNGATAMREDTAPAYLSTVMQNRCRVNGCMIVGTERWTGGTLGPAVCQGFGARTTNGQDNSPVDDANPGLFTSTRWYGVSVSGGRGYISEVWITPAQRGGLGLPGC